MFSLRKCHHCDLLNYEESNYCQACFNEVTNLSPLQFVAYRQKMLFHGFIRLEVLSQSQKKYPPQDVIDLCDQFYKIDTKCLSSHKKSLTQSILNLAKECTKNHEYFVSVELCKIVVAVEPNRHFAHYFMGRSLYQWSAMDQAEAAYKTAIKLEPSPLYHHYYGCLLKRERRYEESLQQFQFVLEEYPNEPIVIMEVGIHYGKLGKYEKAHEYHLKAIKTDDYQTAVYCEEYAYFLGEELQDYEQAKDYFMKAMEIEPNNSMPIYTYAEMLRDRIHDYEESQKQFLKVFKIDGKKSASSHVSYGYLLYLMGDYEGAMKHIDIQLNSISDNIFSNNEFAYLCQGLVRKAIGEDNGAQESLSKSLKCFKRNGNRLHRLEFLKVMKNASNMLHIEYLNELDLKV